MSRPFPLHSSPSNLVASPSNSADFLATTMTTTSHAAFNGPSNCVSDAVAEEQGSGEPRVVTSLQFRPTQATEGLRSSYGVQHPNQHQPFHSLEKVPPISTTALGNCPPQMAQVSSAQPQAAMAVDPEQMETYGIRGTRPAEMLEPVLEPPNLQEWRERLFDVNGILVLTDYQFHTYFPHVDNVYSHRSTQRYKRKPFVSHYYDCRLKGRPSGTPKSDDPNKKKRKRTVRELNQCDVKIKITEYFPGATLHDVDDGNGNSTTLASSHGLIPTSSGGTTQGPYGSVFQSIGQDGQRFYTIQRVNGSLDVNRVVGPHKHTLARSDEVKKSSVLRYLAKQEIEAKKAQASRKPSGSAVITVRKHAKGTSDIKLYSACYCPFSQRVWIALEAKKIAYQYIEADPDKPKHPTTTASSQRAFPSLKKGDWTGFESSVILEFLEDIGRSDPLFPSDADKKATSRLWIDHINTRIVPSFYALLRVADETAHDILGDRLKQDIAALVQAADEQGPYFLGERFSLVDVHLAPFAIRLTRILEPLRGWTDSILGLRWKTWLEAIESNPHVQATMSSGDLYTNTKDLLIHDTGVR